MADLIVTYPKLQDKIWVEAYDFGDSWTKTHPDGPFEELDVAVAVLRSQANYGQMARLLGRPRSQVRNYVERNMPLRDLFHDVWEEFLDEVEDAHKTAALRGDIGTQRFFLTTKAKDRGYVTRAESTGKDGEPLVPTIAIGADTSEEVLAALLKARDEADAAAK